MEKTIDVTIHLYENKDVSIDFYEAETGDTYGICTTLDNAHEIRDQIGDEILGWLDLMADEIGFGEPKLIPVCVYKDSTNLFTPEEIEADNLTGLMFPEWIVRMWYETNKQEFDLDTKHELKIPLEECTFEKWYNEVYTADDMDGLYDYAARIGFQAQREG